ncbi:hypothetical protein D3C77_628120 [compost metagenome]
MAGHVIGDLLRHGTVRTTGKAAIEVPAVDRRGACSRAKGRIVECWHDDDTPADVIWIECVGKFEKCGRPLIFVAVIGAGQKGCRPLAVGDHADRDHYRPPCTVIAAVW